MSDPVEECEVYVIHKIMLYSVVNRVADIFKCSDVFVLNCTIKLMIPNVYLSDVDVKLLPLELNIQYT